MASIVQCEETRQTIRTVSLTETPTREQMEVFWEAMHSDPDDIRQVYSDYFPQTLVDFLAAIDQEIFWFILILVDAEVGGAFWLHDLLRGPEAGSVIGGWIGGYALPTYRHGTSTLMWQVSKKHLGRKGIKHLFSSVSVANRRSQVFTRRVMRFHRVNIYEHLACIGGIRSDFVIYTMHEGDKPLAWAEAHKRAARSMYEVFTAT